MQSVLGEFASMKMWPGDEDLCTDADSASVLLLAECPTTDVVAFTEGQLQDEGRGCSSCYGRKAQNL